MAASKTSVSLYSSTTFLAARGCWRGADSSRLFAIDFSPANSPSAAKRAMASPAPMAAEHQQVSLPDDVLVHVLEYLCTLNDIAARRWCLNKAWLKAHAAHGNLTRHQV